MGAAAGFVGCAAAGEGGGGEGFVGGGMFLGLWFEMGRVGFGGVGAAVAWIDG